MVIKSMNIIFLPANGARGGIEGCYNIECISIQDF
jgi:hypothetical protein